MKNRLIAIMCGICLFGTLTCCGNKKETEKNEQQNICEQTQETEDIKISKELLLGQFEQKNDTNFVLIEPQHCDKPNMYVNKEVYAAYKEMNDSAKKAGINLIIISATRNFDRQKQIWDRKWNRLSCDDASRVKDIMRYSSMPGTSRHHWGTDIDFISVEDEYWTHGYGLKAYEWLMENAHKFGFFHPYTEDENRTGYHSERWHWSYAPLSEPYLEAYKDMVKPEDIKGFNGSYLVDSLDIIEKYVMGVGEPQ